MKNRSFAPFAFIFKVLNLSLMNCFPLTLGKFMGRQPIKERCFDNRQYGAPIQNLIWKTNPFLWWVIFRIFQFCMNRQVFFKGYIKCDFQSHLLKKSQNYRTNFPQIQESIKKRNRSVFCFLHNYTRPKMKIISWFFLNTSLE